MNCQNQFFKIVQIFKVANRLALFSFAFITACNPLGGDTSEFTDPVALISTSVQTSLHADHLVLVSGDAQMGFAGAPLGSPIIVKAVDANNAAVPNTALVATIIGGGGSLSSNVVTTNTVGEAQLNWTLGTGTNLLRVVGMTALPGTPSTLNLSASLSSALHLATATLTNSNPTNSTTFHLTYGIINGVYNQYCILENTTNVNTCSWINGTLPSTFTVTSTNQAKVLSVWIKNTAGSASPSDLVTTNAITLDTSIPSVSITSSTTVNSTSSINAFPVSGTCSSNGTSVSVSVTDGVTTIQPASQPLCFGSVYSTTLNLTSLNQGNITFKADHLNLAGTSAPTASTVGLKDTVLPALTITTPAASSSFNAAGSSSYTVSGSCSENGVTVNVSGTDGVHANSNTATCNTASTPRYTTTLNLSTLSVGTVSLSATQTDLAGNTGTTSISVNRITPSATYSSLSATTGVVANGTSTSTITLTVKDNLNNPVAGFDVTQLTLVSTGTGNTLVAFSGTTNASGQATTTIKTTIAEVKTLSISADSSGNSLTGISTTTTTFIADVPVAAHSSLSATTTITANGSSTSTITLTLKDTNNNVVSGFNTAQLTLASTGTGNTLVAFTGNTNASGVMTTTLASTKAQVKTLSISADSSGNSLTGISTTTTTFIAGAPVAANSTLAATSSIVADGSTTSTITLTLKDTNSNVVSGFNTAQLTLASTGTGNTLVAFTGNTNASGVMTTTLASTKAQAKTLSISADFSSNSLTGISTTTTTFIAGAPVAANSNLAATSSILADGSTTSTITLTLKDTNSNLVSGFNTAQLTLASSGTGNTLVAFTGNTNASGVMTTTLASTKAQVKTLSISADSSSNSLTGISTTTTTFIAGAPVAANSTLAATTSIIADGSTTSTITLTLKDTNSNVVSGFNTAQLTLASTGTGNTLVAFTGNTNASGVMTTTLASTKAQVKTLSISADSSSNSLTGISTTTTTFIAGAPVAANSTLAATSSILADGSTTSTITLTLKDTNSNLVSGFNTAQLTLASTGTGNTLVAFTGNTNASGVMTTTLASTKAQVKTLSISADSSGNSLTGIATTTSTFVPGVPVASTSTLAATSSIAADGSTTSTITLTLKDTNSNVVSGFNTAQLTLAATGTGNTLVAFTGNTNASGVMTTTLASTKAQVKTLSISADSSGNSLTGISTTTTTFVAGAAASLTFTTQPSTTATAGTNLAAQPVVQILDANSNIVTAATTPITLTAYSDASCTTAVASGVAATTNPVTPSSGVSTFAGVKVNKVAAIRLGASDGTNTVCSNAIAVTAGTASASIITGPTTITASSCAAAYTLTTTDSYGNPSAVSGAKIFALSSSGSGAFYSNATCATGATTVTVATTTSTGTFYYKNSVAETATQTATLSGFTPDSTLAVTSNSTSAAYVIGQPDLNTSNNVGKGSKGLWGIHFDGTRLYASEESGYGNGGKIFGWNTPPLTDFAARDFGIGGSGPQLAPTSILGANNPADPRGIHSDGTHFIIADYGGNRVMIYNSIPTTSGAVGDVVLGEPHFAASSAASGTTGLNKPSGVFSTGTKLFVADTGNNRVLIWTTFPTTNQQAANLALGQVDAATGNSANEGSTPTAQSLNGPTGVWVIGTKLFVTDSGNNRVLIWNTIPTSSHVAADVVIGQNTFTTNAANVTAKGLNTPYSTYVSGTKIYIADKAANRVLIYNTIPTTNEPAADGILGQSLYTTSAFGTTASGLYAPTGVTTDSSGYVHVTEAINYRMLTWTTAITTAGQAADHVQGQNDFISRVLRSPGAISGTNFIPNNSVYPSTCTDGTRVFVSDPSRNRVLVWNTFPTANNAAPDFVLGQTSFTGIAGSTTAQNLINPSGVDCTSTTLAVADYGNNRVLLWTQAITSNQQAANIVLGQPDFTTSSQASTALKMAGPVGVSIQNGKLLVADTTHNRVLLWDTIPSASNTAPDRVLGQPDFTTTTANQAGAGSLQSLSTPSAVLYDGTHVLVVDRNNARNLIWAAYPTSTYQQAASVSNSNCPSVSVYSNGTSLYAGNFAFNGAIRANRLCVWNTFPLTTNKSFDRVIGQTDANAYPGTPQLGATGFSGNNSISGSGSKFITMDGDWMRLLIFNQNP